MSHSEDTQFCNSDLNKQPHYACSTTECSISLLQQHMNGGFFLIL